MRIGIIDVGTNVFGLLLGEISGESVKIISEYKVATGIGKGCFSSGLLNEVAFENAEKAFGLIFKHIEEHGGADEVLALATSAIRNSANGKDFVKRMEEIFGFTIEVISGDREAELIYYGIRESLFIWDERVLMMDIGGGSVEFIIADKRDILWKHSFDVGVSRLRDMFHPSDPIREEEVRLIVEHLDRELEPVFLEVERFKPSIMVGCSGSFDTFRDILYPECIGIKVGHREFVPSHELDIKRMEELNGFLLRSHREERMNIKGMTPMRVDLMVIASVMVDLVLKKTGVRELFQSAFSLKEGALFERNNK